MDYFENWTAETPCEIDTGVQKVLDCLSQEQSIKAVVLEIENGWATIEIEFKSVWSLQKVKEIGQRLQESLGFTLLWRSLTPNTVDFVLQTKIERGVGFDEALDYELEEWGNEIIAIEKI